MITANDLRLGNLVFNNRINQNMVVTSLTHDQLLKSNGVEEWYIDMENERDISPIPLSPEILEKAGFEKTEDKKGECWDLEGFRLWHDGKGFYHINSETLTHFDYLHHLQNYYHSMCLEELTINL